MGGLDLEPPAPRQPVGVCRVPGSQARRAPPPAGRKRPLGLSCSTGGDENAVVAWKTRMGAVSEADHAGRLRPVRTYVGIDGWKPTLLRFGAYTSGRAAADTHRTRYAGVLKSGAGRSLTDRLGTPGGSRALGAGTRSGWCNVPTRFSWKSSPWSRKAAAWSSQDAYRFGSGCSLRGRAGRCLGLGQRGSACPGGTALPERGGAGRGAGRRPARPDDAGREGRSDGPDRDRQVAGQDQPGQRRLHQRGW